MIREEFVSTAMAIIFEHRFVTDPKAMDEWAQAGNRMVHTGSFRYPGTLMNGWDFWMLIPPVIW